MAFQTEFSFVVHIGLILPEERDHDDRLRALPNAARDRVRAKQFIGRTFCVSTDHDDDIAALLGRLPLMLAVAPERSCDERLACRRWRTDRQSVAHALHHSDHLFFQSVPHSARQLIESLPLRAK
jgi:hypothetical protein